MKSKKVLTVAALAGLALGGLSVTAASAQSYGDESSTTVEQTESTVDNGSDDAAGIVLVQDTEVPDTVDGEAPEAERSGRRGHRGGCNLDAAAEAIGIDEADLKSAIESGDSIADVAEANGVDADVVIDAMVNEKAERIAEKVAEGRITQDEADAKLADLEARITDRVNGVEEAPQS